MSDAKPNKLIHEKSPYLLQHAKDPVNWYPWNEEAFEKAKTEARPIFLSIGYASCHWCHVMAKESFQNESIAKALNENFIAIKVDREELPHIDRLYMDFAAAMQSSAGGWPLNIFITPELKPMYAATYLPARTSQGMMGLQELIEHIQRVWESDERSLLYERADQVVDLFQKINLPEGNELPQEEDIEKIVQSYFTNLDAVNGGFDGAPKFPQTYSLEFLMNYVCLSQDARAAFYVTLTLDKMALGGLRDHVGGGFHRYTVDAKWAIPHFEKMLYDNALLAEVYTEAYRYFQKPIYERCAEETFDFLLREMCGADGGFYSSIDADSDGKEGKFYTWTINEIEEILNNEEAAICTKLYQMSHAGNFEGRSVIFRLEKDLEFSEKVGEVEGQVSNTIKSINKKLFASRMLRQAPLVDDKVLTSWNALVLQSLAKGARLLQREDCEIATRKLLAFLQTHLSTEHGLKRRYRDKEAKFNGILDDYVFLIRALITLYEYDFGSECLDFAESLWDVVVERFKSDNGALYYTEHEDALFFRNFEFYDGAEPSGNSVGLECALRLYALTRNKEYLSVAEDVLRTLKEKSLFYSPGNAYQGLAMQRYIDKKAMTMVIALNQDEEKKEEIWAFIRKNHIPHLSLIWLRENERPPWKHDDMVLVEGKTTIYLCSNNTCLAPITDIEALKKAF